MISDFEKIVLMIDEKNNINLNRIRAYNKWRIAERKKENKSVLKELYQHYKDKSVEGKKLFKEIRLIKKNIGAKFEWNSSGYCVAIKVNDLVIHGREAIVNAATDIKLDAMLLGKELS